MSIAAIFITNIYCRISSWKWKACFEKVKIYTLQTGSSYELAYCKDQHSPRKSLFDCVKTKADRGRSRGCSAPGTSSHVTCWLMLLYTGHSPWWQIEWESLRTCLQLPTGVLMLNCILINALHSPSCWTCCCQILESDCFGELYHL